MALFIQGHLMRNQIEKYEEKAELFQGRSFVEELSKGLNVSDKFIQTKRFKDIEETQQLISINKKQYIVNFLVQKRGLSLSVYVRESNGKKINSKPKQILTIKQIIKNRYQKQQQLTIYLANGYRVMSIKLLFFPLTTPFNKTIISYYKEVILKNLHIFHRMQKGFGDISQQENLSEFHQNLYLYQIINTTSAHFDIIEDKSQFKVAQETLMKQKKAITQIHSQIIKQPLLEASNSALFQMIKTQNYSKWVHSNLINSYETVLRKGRKIISIIKVGDKKIDDFLYNIVKIQIKDRIPKPIGEGGSSYIFLIRALLSYVNSVDFTSYKCKDEKSQKLLVIKSIKPELQSQLEYKLRHQKDIVSKLKGSCSMFIPKYYGTQKDSTLNNVLLMQHLQGQQLDSYVGFRNDTISLWTKIYLLINVINGIRHLNSYEIVHFDIKPINIIVCRNLITKILDYGQAYHKDLFPKQYCPGYTFPYAAPQIFERYQDLANRKAIKPLELNEKQDVFAFGVIMYEIIFSRPIFNLCNQKEKKIYYEKLILERIFINFQMLRSYGEDVIVSTILRIIMRCLEPYPQDRPTFDWICVSLKLILNSYIGH